MIRAITAVLLTAACLLAGATQSQAASRTSCEKFSGKPLSGQVAGATAHWTCNTYVRQGRVHVRCGSPSGGYADRNGGWVTSVGYPDTAYCPGSDPALLAAAWQERAYAGAPVSTHWFYGP